MQALWVVGEAAGLSLREPLVEVEPTQAGWYCTTLPLSYRVDTATDSYSSIVG